jgi:hypothetical protein
VSLQRCSGCQERKPGKYANTTVAWWNVANKRLAYRLKLCKDCYGETIEPVRLNNLENELSCPYCHTEPGDDMDPTYVTMFIPNFGKMQLELATCAADAVQLRSYGVEHGELLQDVGVGGLVPGPQTPVSDWDEYLGTGAYANR